MLKIITIKTINSSNIYLYINTLVKIIFFSVYLESFILIASDLSMHVSLLNKEPNGVA